MEISSPESNFVKKEFIEDSEEFLLSSKPKKVSSKTLSGLWTEMEKIKYITFIASNTEMVSDRLTRRKKKVFEKMSRAIKTRTPTQCRSHHQKCMKRFHTLDRIIEELNKEPKVKKNSETDMDYEPSISQVEATIKNGKVVFTIWDQRCQAW